MTALDDLLTRWRRRVALKFVLPGSRVLDIGTHDGGLFHAGGITGVGIDPALVGTAGSSAGVTLIQGAFPADLPKMPPSSFDCVTALAVVEHVAEAELQIWADQLSMLVRAGGRVVITVPAPRVDRLLHILMRLRLVDGIEAHQHHGFEPDQLTAIFGAPTWRLLRRRTFQLGFNNLFVFERTAAE
ncbi:MAG TPA: methyltransferase domain-containing protein [Mycobacteriales bacterium]|nr:methyltransferase domain-containing protein [Mycobacteriales bacterium]